LCEGWRFSIILVEPRGHFDLKKHKGLHLESRKRQIRLGLSFIAMCAPVFCLAFAAQTVARPIPSLDLDKQFASTVRPFVAAYCASCHGKQKPQAQFDLTAYSSTESVLRDFAHWSRALDKLAAEQMPPPNAANQPSA